MSTFYSMAKLSDFWLIFTEIDLGGRKVPLYLAPGAGWQWTTDVEGARRFQYSYEALTHAFDHCPLKIYRSEMMDMVIEVHFLADQCTITRNGRTTTLSLDALRALKAMALPSKVIATLPPALLLDAPKEALQ